MTTDDPDRRLRALAWLTHRIIAYCFQYEHVYTMEGLSGVAAWLPPGKFSSHAFQQLKMVLQLQLYMLPMKVGWQRLGRWLTILQLTEIAHQQDMGQTPCWYLGMMVVYPTKQGQGIGSRLLAPVLTQASHTGIPCYVVTFTEQAVRFYQKNGFAIIQQKKLAPNAPAFWTLQRNP